MHKWYYTIVIPFIQENIDPVMLFEFLARHVAQGVVLSMGHSLHKCIFLGGQLRKLARVTYMQYISLQTKSFSCISTRFRSF